MAKWIARNSDHAWMVQGYGDPALIHSQPSAYTEVEVSGGRCPNPRLTRHDAAAPSKTRAATEAEIAAYDAACQDAKAAEIDTDLLIQAAAQLDYEERQKLMVKVGETLRTPAECTARIKAIYRRLL